MLSLHPDPNKLRAAWNLFPRADGSLYTRPGAVQVAEGRIGRAVPWGNRVLFEKIGRIVLWDGAVEHDIVETGYTLQAVPYQAVTEAGAREDRLYVADGVRTLWYLTKSGSTYVRTTVVNELLDGSSQPYPIPIPFCIANWRNRLWIGDGTHRIYHCQNDQPHYWDPLWELQFQGAGPDAVRLIRPLGDSLAVGLEHSIWAVTGTSPYNWQRNELINRRGVSGQDAAAVLGNRLWYVDSTGLYELGQEQPISEDIREAFLSFPAGAQLVADTARRLLFLNLTGRVFVMHVDRPGAFTELYGFLLFGVFAADLISGWYGTDGLWVYGQIFLPDQTKAGAARAISARFDTWDQRPNHAGSGRALCNRTLLTVSGPDTTAATYAVTSDEEFFTDTFALSPAADPFPDVPGVTQEYWPFRPERRELVPRVPGQIFRHTIVSTAPIEIHSFEPQYRFGKEDT
jgi:hypothetical protein